MALGKDKFAVWGMLTLWGWMALDTAVKQARCLSANPLPLLKRPFLRRIHAIIAAWAPKRKEIPIKQRQCGLQMSML